jgi:phytanoyl-CoA hydroxylase
MSGIECTTMVITKSELDSYHRNGFLVIENFVAAGECDLLRKRAEELVDEFEPTGIGITLLYSRTKQNR